MQKSFFSLGYNIQKSVYSKKKLETLFSAIPAKIMIECHNLQKCCTYNLCMSMHMCTHRKIMNGYLSSYSNTCNMIRHKENHVALCLSQKFNTK